MITKRTGNGQTECVRCKEKGKFALNWDSFLYTFNDKPYCFNCLMEILEEKDNIIDKAIEFIEDKSYKYTSISKELKEKEIDKILSILRGEE